ncbi:MAG: hypothetical protein J7M08_00045 [Planctomycetes bacterium]|nr:hypothetical protein [Planctomycetota bacterium]
MNVYDFPRTTVGGVSLARLIVGTNWFLGYSHTSNAQDRFIRELFDTPGKIADVIEVFARGGCNAVMSPPNQLIYQALREVEQRTGEPMILICTPSYLEMGNPDTWKPAVDQVKQLGATFCFPHQCVTDPCIDVANKRLSARLVEHLSYVREAGMIPGLSSHMPDAITCSDACGADVESYLQLYNAAGFLCQVETDWLCDLIHKAHKPVMTIKPLAAGRLPPHTGLTFVWNTLRDCDMVTVGTMSAYEAEEALEISRACLERREARVKLQTTRSKRTLT